MIGSTMPLLRSAAASITLAFTGVAVAAGEQPVARPIDPDAIAVSRVVVAVRPVGRVPYDGLTLPLTAPDGRFIATQTGRTPSWDSILAIGGPANPPIGLKLAAFSLPDLAAPSPAPAGEKAPPPQTSITALKWTAQPPSGALLGRSADARGFLIEVPHPRIEGGGRSIARIAWLTGETEWLVRVPEGASVLNAHAVLSGRGDLAYVTRDASQPVTRLALRRTSAEGVTAEIVHASAGGLEAYAFPFFSPDGATLAAFAIPADDLAGGRVSLVAFAVPENIAVPHRDLIEIARLDMGLGGITTAYQIATTLQTPCPMPPIVNPSAAPAAAAFQAALTFFSFRDGAAVAWNPRTGDFLRFEAGTAAAVPFRHADFGVVLADDKGLAYQSLRLGSGAESGDLLASRTVSVMAGRAFPRSTTADAGVTIVFTPPKSGDQQAFEVLLISPALPDDAPPGAP